MSRAVHSRRRPGHRDRFAALSVDALQQEILAKEIAANNVATVIQPNNMNSSASPRREVYHQIGQIKAHARSGNVGS